MYTHIQYGLFTNIVSHRPQPTRLLVKLIIRFVDSLVTRFSASAESRLTNPPHSLPIRGDLFSQQQLQASFG